MAERRDDLEGPEVVGPVARGIAGMSTFVSMGRAGEGCERGGGYAGSLGQDGVLDVRELEAAEDAARLQDAV